MNALDILIIIMVISSLFRGFEVGLVRQLFSTVGFFVGLFLGAWLQQYTVKLADSPLSASVMTISTTLGCAFVFLTIGEVLGTKLKVQTLHKSHVNKFDNYLGSVLGAATLITVVWLTASVIFSFPAPSIQQEIRGSSLITYLNRSLPPAPDVIGRLGKLIDPNGFPQVFAGEEPIQEGNTTIPGISAKLQDAVNKTKASTVKFEGLGCGGIVDGSGFVIAQDLVATNAHVVAGVKKPYVKDSAGQHSATPVWFDPELDFAIVRVENLAGSPLVMSGSLVRIDTTGAILGYPGGGALTAGGAKVLDQFTAKGRDIYGGGITFRDVYSLAAHVIPGNSGGPLISEDGSVIGVVFAQSTVNDNVGYALTTPQLGAAVSQAQAQNRAVSTGTCAE